MIEETKTSDEPNDEVHGPLQAILLGALSAIAAAVAAGFLAVGTCLGSMHFHSSIADISCGHNVAYPWALYFLILVPTFYVIARALVRMISK